MLLKIGQIYIARRLITWFRDLESGVIIVDERDDDPDPIAAASNDNVVLFEVA